MRSSIKITGWAPQGEPTPKGPGSAEFFLQLSALPDATWRRLFERTAGALSGVHRHDVVFELREQMLRVWCPVARIAAVVESAKHLVSDVNVAALEFDAQLGQLRMKEAESHGADWDGIAAEKDKIRFD